MNSDIDMIKVSEEEIENTIEFFLASAKSRNIELMQKRTSLLSKVGSQSKNSLMKTGNFKNSSKLVDSGYFYQNKFQQNNISGKFQNSESDKSKKESNNFFNSTKYINSKRENKIFNDEEFFNN